MAFRSANGLAPGSASTSAVITKPTGTASGDILYCEVSIDVDGDTISPPSGWTTEDHYSRSGTSDQTLGLFRKVAGGSEPATYTFTWTTNTGYAAVIGAWSGRDTGSSIAPVRTNDNTLRSSPISVALTGITAALNDDIAWFSDCDGAAASGIWNLTAAPGSYTADVTTSGATSWAAVHVAHRDAVSAGATGTLTGTATDGAASGTQAGFGGWVVRLPIPGITLTVTENTLSLSGQSITLSLPSDVTLPVTESSITLSGQDVSVSFTAAWVEGTLTLTGQDVGIAASGTVTLALTENTITLTGQVVDLFTGFVDVTFGTVTLTGQAITLTIGYFVIDVGVSTVTLSGQSVNLLNSLSLAYSGSRLTVLQVSTVGKLPWVHYIPVLYVTLGTTDLVNRYDDGGAIAVTTIGSGTGLTEWRDYIPVATVGAPDPLKQWRRDDAGYLRVVEVA